MQHHIFQQHFATLFENACIGILVVNKDGIIEAANNHVTNEFGYNKSEMIGQRVEFLLPASLREKHEHNRAQYAVNPVSVSLPADRNLKGLKKNGTEFPVEMGLGFYKDASDVYYVAFVNDLTKHKEAEDTIQHLTAELDQKVKESTRSLKATVEQLSKQIRETEQKDDELKKALAKEKELNELKSRFVSTASHEFKTPLSGVLASTYLLSKYTKEGDQPQRDKHIKRIISSVNLLNEVLADFLSIDKIEQGKFKPHYTDFDIEAAADEIIQNLHHILKRGQNILYLHTGDKNVHTDHSFVQHILTNLLSNAVKYSAEEKTIFLSTGEQDGTLTLSVRDEGIGIPENEMQNLYKRFFRSTNAAYIEGTGLGLNIVKKCVDMLDGTMECKSELNKGTEFTIKISSKLK